MEDQRYPDDSDQDESSLLYDAWYAESRSIGTPPQSGLPGDPSAPTEGLGMPGDHTAKSAFHSSSAPGFTDDPYGITEAMRADLQNDSTEPHKVGAPDAAIRQPATEDPGSSRAPSHVHHASGVPAAAEPAEYAGHIPMEPEPRKSANIELLLDVSLPVSIELGRTRMSISDILELGSGSIVELDKLAGEPVDILVNNKPLAKGEVVVLDENFGVRVTSLVSPRERLEQLNLA